MGWRLYRRKKLLPGVSLGLSRSGPSVRFGVRGAGVTLGGRSGLRTTVGIPGSGVYYTATPHHRRTRRSPAPVHSTYSAGGSSNSGAIGCLVLLGLGVGIALVVATSGLILIPAAVAVGLWIWWRRTRPDFKAGQLIKQAKQLPGDQAVAVLHKAIEIDPHGQKTLVAAGDWFSEQQCWADAAECYAGCLHQKADWDLESNYTKALVYAGRLDEAIPRLEQFRGMAWLTDESRASVTSLLALAYLAKGDASQANALVSEQPLQRHNLGFGLQQCLYLRAVSRYLLGQKSRAVSDLDRLYAINSSYPRLAEAKAEMLAGSYALDPPKPYPDWYPTEHQLAEHEEAPEDAEAQSAGQPPAPVEVAPTATEAVATSAPATATEQSPWLSPDGKWRWDGTRWVENAGESGAR